MSQTPVEQMHIRDALVFELSKVEKSAIRERMVSHLLNIDEALAKGVAAGLGLHPMPKPAPAAKPTKKDLAKSPALSILSNAKQDFAGRKLGILLTDGADAALLGALKSAAEAAGADVEVVAPMVAGIKASDGAEIAVQQRVNGGPSVLYDAVALIPSAAGGKALARDPAARDFVADAFAHAKFIAYAKAAAPLLEKAGVAADLDEGCTALDTPNAAKTFLDKCRALRFWAREQAMQEA